MINFYSKKFLQTSFKHFLTLGLIMLSFLTSYSHNPEPGTDVQPVLLASKPTISFINSAGFDENVAADGEGGSISISDLNIQVGTPVSNTAPVAMTWNKRTDPGQNNNNNWHSVTFGNNRFVAVASSGSDPRVMTSFDGITWTGHAAAANNDWESVTYGNGLFVAVASSGTGNRVMISADGVTWIARNASGEIAWNSVTYGNGIFVAVAESGNGKKVMTSTDGITWTGRTEPGSIWSDVTYANGVFVAVATDGNGSSYQVMTSADGITWTGQMAASTNRWESVTYGNDLFVAVAASGDGDRVMTSPDGITWTLRNSAIDNDWYDVTFGDGLFVAVAYTGSVERIMTSPDGINWTAVDPVGENLQMWDITYSNGMFVSVGVSNGGTNKILTSGTLKLPVTVSAVTFTGDLKIAAMLTGSYTLGGVDEGGEDESTYQWYRYDEATGDASKTPIDGATAKTYTLQAADDGKYISFEVTPHDGSDAGDMVKSDRQGPVKDPTMAPVFTSVPVETAEVGVEYSYTVVAGDPSGLPVTVTASTLPGWLNLSDPLSTSTVVTNVINQPGAIAQDAEGNIYVISAEYKYPPNTTIARITPDGNVDVNWANSEAEEVFGMVAFDGYLYLANIQGDKITKIEIANPDAGESLAANIPGGPTSLTVYNGDLYAGLRLSKVVKVNLQTKSYVDYAATGSDVNVRGISFDADGNLYIAEWNKDRIVKFDGSNFTTVIEVNDPWGIAHSADGTLFVASTDAGVGVQKYASDHTFIKQLKQGTAYTVSINPYGRVVYGTDSGNELVKAETVQLLSGIPNPEDVGDHEVHLTATGSGQNTNQVFTIKVVPGPVVISPTDGILYVNQNVSGGNGNGDSWANAIPELADALNWARKQWDAKTASWGEESPLQIWVAKGTYKPLYRASEVGYGTVSDRDKAFVLVPYVKIFGGFSGGESELNTRDWTANETILSGDIGTGGDITDNAYHVVITAGDNDHPMNALSILDGFTIAKGNSSGTDAFFVNGVLISQSYGGGVSYSKASSVLSNVIIRENTGKSGGGFFISDSPDSPILTNMTITENTSGFGGGIYSSNSSFTLTNVTVSGNTSTGSGGGIATQNGYCTLTNVAIYGNISAGTGAGINNQSGVYILTNVTVSGNNGGGGVGNGIYGLTEECIVRNSIIWGNGPNNVQGDFDLVNSSNNIIEGLDGHMPATDPLFVDAANANFSLKENSAAVNAGSNDAYTGAGGDAENDKDMGGNPRVYNFAAGRSIDIGAYEYQGDPETGIRYVKTADNGGTSDGDGKDWTTASSDLQAMIDELAGIDGGEVWVAKGTYIAREPSVSQADGFAMRNKVAIFGGFAGGETSLSQRDWKTNVTVLSGNNKARVINNPYTNNNQLANTAVLDGFTIRDGYNTSNGSYRENTGNGGGIYNSYASPVLRNLIITRNFADQFGGGMYITDGSPVIQNVTIADNEVGGDFEGVGGGLFIGYGAPELTNVVISGNIAGLSSGGIENNTEGNPVLTNVLITGNSTFIGGGMSNYYETAPKLTNVTISGNYAYDGAGMYNSDGVDLTIVNSIIWGNGGSSSNYAGSKPNNESSSNLIEGLTGHNTVNGKKYTGKAADLFVSPAAATEGNPTTEGNYQLTPCSPAFNAGDNAKYPDATTAQDVTGNPRLAWGNVDMGALEYQDIPAPRLILPADKTYKIGDALHFTVNYFKPVTITGNPYIGVTIGAEAKKAYYTSISEDEQEITFSYVITEGDEDTNGIGIGAAIVLNGGTIMNEGSAAELTYCPAASAAGIKIDGIRPVITVVSVASSNTAPLWAKTGDKVTVTLKTSEPVEKPVVTIAGNAAAVSSTGTGKGMQWKAEYVLTADDEEDLIDFKVGGLADIAGNTTTDITTTTDDSSVRFDKTSPAVPVGLTVSSGDGQLTFGWMANEETDLKAYKIYGGTAENPTTLLETVVSTTKTYTQTGLINGTTYYYRIAAVDNAGNESTVSSNATAVPMGTQTITFNTLAAKIYGSPDFNPGATASSELTVSYTSDNPDVATIADGKIHITGVGSATITATQSGTAAFTAAEPQTQLFTVNKKDITVALNASPVITKVYDGTTDSYLAQANYQLNGLEGNDEVMVAGTASYETKDAGVTKSVMVNSFILYGAKKDNYNLTTISATTTGTITSRPVTVRANSGQEKTYGDADPVFMYTIGSDVRRMPVQEGLVEGEELTGALAREAGKDVGAYDITIGTLTGGANYALTLESAEFNIRTRPIWITANGGQSKVYGAADPALTYTVTQGGRGFVPAPGGLVSGDALTGKLEREAGEQVGKDYTISLGTLNAGSNYELINYTGADFEVTKAPLTVTADNKTKFAGTANPVFTVSYSGFVNGEKESILKTLPVASTTADISSPLGTYSIVPGGAAAGNYEISYVPGILKVVPGAPTGVSLAMATVYENAPAGIVAGTLSSTSEDPSATFTYSLVSGSGSTDNGLFSISGSEIKTAAPLNFEQKAVYSVRVRSTTQHNFSLDQELTISIDNVNEQPALAAITAQTICYTTGQQHIPLSGITAGEDAGQSTTLSVTADNPDLFEELTMSKNDVQYIVKNGASGTANIIVTVKDDGGTANGGIDTYSRSFTLTVNPLPVVTIVSDLGTDISKGATVNLTASGGSSYSWGNASGIISGQNTAVLTVRPSETAVYTVTVTNASGCTEQQSITLKVLEDYKTVEVTNIMSPNGDGVNDFLVIKNIDMYPNNEIRVFDRAGRLLFGQKNYKNTWDAAVNGSPLAEGTYYYIVDFGPGKGNKKGFITIVRN